MITPPPPLTEHYLDTPEQVQKQHGKHALEVSTALITPELQHGKHYHRRTIKDRLTIYYASTPAPGIPPKTAPIP